MDRKSVPSVDCIDLYVVTAVGQLRRTCVNHWRSTLVKTSGIHEHMIVLRSHVEELESMMMDTVNASVPPKCILP
jgi:sarcosine oxidase gamma subunit